MELALLAPMLVVLVLWANYFWEVQRVRLKAAEVARYVSFERTVRQDVDAIAAEAYARYKDLDGSTKTGELGTAYRNRLTLTVQAEDAPAPLKSEGISERGGLGGAGGLLGAAAGALGGTAEAVARQMDLDPSKGAVRTTVEVHIENGIIPSQIALYTTGFDGPWLDLHFTEEFYVFHDTWRAWAPGDDPNNSYPIVEQHTYDRTSRIVYAGLAQGGGGALNAIGNMLSVLGLDYPLDDSYMRDSVLMREVGANGHYPATRPTRTVPGDVLQAAYWRNDTRGCFNSCEPQAIKQKRGLVSRTDYGDNWPMRAYNCRGAFFQGAIKSEAPESVYADPSTLGAMARGYHNYGGANACE
ncbi:pilus assembly protein [Pyxidicoccus caerfyrddinensis]|uniref:pilus assembly protein n=1 Tax=Pyxidicoccus caerfyrddinensis TaxID=2709663 RepID=UPI001F0814F9|nr:pilus assembly protein [Pyxidicoccus caerfyrddinensis]